MNSVLSLHCYLTGVIEEKCKTDFQWCRKLMELPLVPLRARVPLWSTSEAKKPTKNPRKRMRRAKNSRKRIGSSTTFLHHFPEPSSFQTIQGLSYGCLFLPCIVLLERCSPCSDIFPFLWLCQSLVTWWNSLLQPGVQFFYSHWWWNSIAYYLPPPTTTTIEWPYQRTGEVSLRRTVGTPWSQESFYVPKGPSWRVAVWVGCIRHIEPYEISFLLRTTCFYFTVVSRWWLSLWIESLVAKSGGLIQIQHIE